MGNTYTKRFHELKFEMGGGFGCVCVGVGAGVGEEGGCEGYKHV